MVNLKDLQPSTDMIVMLEEIKGIIGPILIISLINLIFTTVLQYYIIHNPIDSNKTIFVSALNAMKFIVPYIIIIVLLAFTGSIAIILGAFLLIIGAFFAGLYIMTLYLFILPVMMAEETNIGDTIARTFSLVHRNLWANIGWVAVFIIIIIVISVLLSGIILLPFSGSFLKTIFNPEEASALLYMTTNPVFIVLSALSSALTLPLMPIFASILYFNGKASEEERNSFNSVNPEDDRIRVEDLYSKPYSDDHPDKPEDSHLQ
jgi:hypothetical protein